MMPLFSACAHLSSLTYIKYAFCAGFINMLLSDSNCFHHFSYSMKVYSYFLIFASLLCYDWMVQILPKRDGAFMCSHMCCKNNLPIKMAFLMQDPIIFPLLSVSDQLL